MSNSVIQAFKGLNVTPSSEDHDKIYEVSYQYLSNIKQFNDVKSFNNCLVALINSDKYFKALELIKKVPQDLIIQFAVEVGYVYYKTNNSDKLVLLYETVNNSGTSSFIIRGLRHVLAQDYYKNGNNDKALELYYALIKTNDEIDNPLDLATNELAIISQAKFLSHESHDAVSTNVNGDENHDIVFNNALIALGEKNLSKCLQYLNEATKLLDALNLDQQSYDIEKCSILLLTAYVYHIQGKIEDSKQILTQFEDISSPFNDLILSLIIKNNYYSVGELNIDEDNFNLIHRDLNYQHNLNNLSNKLTSFQNSYLVKNNLLLLYLTNTLSKSSNYLSSQKVNQYIRQFDGDYSILSFKLLVKLGITNDDLIGNLDATARKLFKFINTQSLITQDNFNELTVAAMILLSINSTQEKYNQSVSVLEKLVEYNLEHESLLPGLIGSLIKVYEYLDFHDKLSNLLNVLIEKVKTITDMDTNNYNFIKLIGFKLLIANDNDKANTIFNILQQKNPQDPLIQTVLTNEPSDALIPIPDLIENVEDVLSVNIESLITKPISSSKSSSFKKSTSQKVEKINKKQRKPKFGPGKVIKPQELLKLDEERWLPMKLRSYYKPKKSSKKKASGGHQGAVESLNTTSNTQTNSTSSSKKKNNKKKGKK